MQKQASRIRENEFGEVPKNSCIKIELLNYFPRTLVGVAMGETQGSMIAFVEIPKD